MSQTREDNLSSVGRTALGLVVLGFSSALFGALVVGPRLGEQLVPAASALEKRPVSGPQPAASDETAGVAQEGGEQLASVDVAERDAPPGISTSDTTEVATGDPAQEPAGPDADPDQGIPGAADADPKTNANGVTALPAALPGAPGASRVAAEVAPPQPAVAADDTDRLAAEREREAAREREAEAQRLKEAAARSRREAEERRQRAAELARQERERRQAEERERERAAEREREAQAKEREREQRLAAERERREEEQRREAARKPRSQGPRRAAADADRKPQRQAIRPSATDPAERKAAVSPRASSAALPVIRPEVAEDQGVFKVRVGRFKSREEAEKARDALNRSAGKEAFLVRDGETYRLQVGAYKDRANADKLAGELQGSGSRSESGSDR